MTDKEMYQAIRELYMMLQTARIDFYPDRRKSLVTAIRALWYILSSNEEKCGTGQDRAVRNDCSVELWQKLLGE